MKYLIWLRSLIATLFFPFTVLIIAPMAILGHILFRHRPLDDFFMSLWGRWCCALVNVKIVVHGKSNWPKDKGFLVLFNHTSFFDVFALAGAFPDLRFGAKAELFKIPLFGAAMRTVGTLPIERNNREKVFRIYEEAKSRFEAKEKFALAPEGGRFFGPHLAPFKAGPFIFAMSAEAPLVPVVILGAYECLPKGHFLFNKNKWRREIHLHVLPPIETKGFSNEQRSELQQKVYASMDPIWSEYYKTKGLSSFV